MNVQYKKVFEEITKTDEEHIHQLENQAIDNLRNIHEKKK